MKVKSEIQEKESLVEFTDIAPFTVAKVWNDDISIFEYFVLFGQYRMTDNSFKSLADAEDWIKNVNYETVISLIGIFMAEFKEKDMFNLNNLENE